MEPADAPRTVIRGHACAMGTPLVARVVGGRLDLVAVDGAPEVRTSLVSAREDKRPLIEVVHQEVAWATRRLGPLVLPELAQPLPL